MKLDSCLRQVLLSAGGGACNYPGGPRNGWRGDMRRYASLCPCQIHLAGRLARWTDKQTHGRTDWQAIAPPTEAGGCCAITSNSLVAPKKSYIATAQPTWQLAKLTYNKPRAGGCNSRTVAALAISGDARLSSASQFDITFRARNSNSGSDSSSSSSLTQIEAAKSSTHCVESCDFAI